MRVSRSVGWLVVVLSMMVPARPAAAQGVKSDFSAGYQHFSFRGDNQYQDNGDGWGMSLAIGKDTFKGVMDFGGVYSPNLQLHSVQGGIEYSGRSRRVVPFVRLLSGVGFLKINGYKTTDFLFTLDAGAKVMISAHVGAQVSAGFTAIANPDGGASGGRLYAGIVIRN